MLTVETTSAQTITLNNLPPTTSNSRFYSSHFSVKHPSLSANGFDCGANCDKGLGLKQILEKVYNQRQRLYKDVYEEILIKANKNLIASPTERWEYTTNTRRIEARAFIALATYVMEHNGEGHELESLPDNIETPGAAAGRLRSAPTNTDAWRIVKSWKDDGVKGSTVLENMARTMDLYLALENAYCYYGNQGHTPSQQEWGPPGGGHVGKHLGMAIDTVGRGNASGTVVSAPLSAAPGPRTTRRYAVDGWMSSVV